MLWLNKKKTNRQIIVHKTQHRKLMTKQHKNHQKLGDLMCFGRVIITYSIFDTRRVAHDKISAGVNQRQPLNYMLLAGDMHKINV